MVLRLLIELKWLDENFEVCVMLNKRRRWFNSSRVKLPFRQDVGKLVLAVNVFDLDLVVQN